MSKTKAQLEVQITELENQVADLELRLEAGDDEEIPEHGHSRHESRQERQNRLRSIHMEDELQTLGAS